MIKQETKEYMVKEFQNFLQNMTSKFEEPIKDRILSNFDNFLLTINKSNNFDKNEILNILTNYKTNYDIPIIDNLNNDINKDNLKKKVCSKIILNDFIKCNNIEYENLLYLNTVNLGKYYEVLDYYINNFIKEKIKIYLYDHKFINEIEFNIKLDNYDKANFILFLAYFDLNIEKIDKLKNIIKSLMYLCLCFFNIDKDDRIKNLYKIFNFIKDNLEDKNNLLNILNNLINNEEFIIGFKLLMTKFISEIINFTDNEKLISIFSNLKNIDYNLINLKKVVNSFKYYLLRNEDFDTKNYSNKIYFMVFIKFLIELYKLDKEIIIINIIDNNELFILNESIESNLSIIININNKDEIKDFLMSYNYHKENQFKEESEKEFNEKKGFEDFFNEDDDEVKINDFCQSQINNDSDIDIFEKNENNNSNMVHSNLSNLNQNTKKNFAFWIDWINSFNNF